VDIERSVTVITGAASGIGAAAARAFAGRGARLVLGDAREEPLREVADDLAAAGAEVAWRVTDVTREADVAALMDLATERFGAIHVVLPSAGIFRDAFAVRVKDGRVTRTMSLDDFRAVIDVNLTGTFLTLREAATRMIDGGHRGVLFTVSSINKEGELGQINYASSKVAVALWPKLLGGELHAQGVTGIRVVGVAPGYVETPILSGMPEAALARVLERVPLGRLIRTDEITALLLHVVENEAIHATTLEVAGGAIASGMPK
jgi:3-oxoacyl-[acyl-carrier protein] reductase